MQTEKTENSKSIRQWGVAGNIFDSLPTVIGAETFFCHFGAFRVVPILPISHVQVNQVTKKSIEQRGTDRRLKTGELLFKVQNKRLF